MARKPNARLPGEGSIFNDERGFYNVQIPLGKVRGRLRYKRIRCKTLPGLHEKRREFEKRLALGLVSTSKTPTVETFLKDWLVQAVPARNRYSTARSYRQIARDYLIPHLGNYRLDALEPKHVQHMLNTIAAEKAPRTVRNIRACLRRALNVAKRDSLVTRNVAELVDVPQAKKTEIRTLNAEEARRLLVVAETHRLKALYWTALLLGLREGELCGLRWADVHLDDAKLYITQSVQRQKHGDAGGKLYFVEPKTESSAAPLPVPKILIGILREHRARQDEERCYEKWQEQGLVFPSEVGTPLEPRNLVRHFKSVLKQAGLPTIPFHNLRHTCATLLMESGEHPRVIQAILRHASFHTTMAFYAHAQPQMQREAVEGLGMLIGEPERVLELPKKQVKKE
jgi:integrase